MPEKIPGKVMVFAVFAGLLVLHANAQERPPSSPRQFPRTEIFLGLSHVNLSLGSQSAFIERRHYWGVQVDAKINISEHIGFLFDLARQDTWCTVGDVACIPTHVEVGARQYLIGPEFTLRTHRFNTFVHALAGASRIAMTEQIASTWGPAGEITPSSTVDLGSRTTLAFAAGGGIDLHLRRHFAFRLFQADYIPTRLDGKWQSHVRLATGLLVEF